MHFLSVFCWNNDIVFFRRWFFKNTCICCKDVIKILFFMCSIIWVFREISWKPFNNEYETGTYCILRSEELVEITVPNKPHIVVAYISNGKMLQIMTFCDKSIWLIFFSSMTKYCRTKVYPAFCLNLIIFFLPRIHFFVDQFPLCRQNLIVILQSCDFYLQRKLIFYRKRYHSTA